MAKTPTVPATPWTANSTTPYADQSYMNGDRPAGGAPNSGAVLSGGTIVRGLYDFASGSAPADSNYFQGANSPATLGYSNNYAEGVWPANDDANSPYTTIRTLSPDNYQEYYIEFDARFPGTVWGNKFCKPVGRNNGSGTSNMTAGPNFGASQNFDRVSFGDGTSTSNDTQNQIMLDGSTDAADVGRGWATANINTPVGNFTPADWGTDWHTFRMYFKFSSGETVGTDTPDGAFYLEIDGVLYCDAGGFYNRHYSNSLYWDGMTLFGTMQNHTADITMQYDNIKLSQGGFV